MSRMMAAATLRLFFPVARVLLQGTLAGAGTATGTGWSQPCSFCASPIEFGRITSTDLTDVVPLPPGTGAGAWGTEI